MLNTRDGQAARIVCDYGNVLGNTLALKLAAINAALEKELVSKLRRPLRPEECNSAYFDKHLPELKPVYTAIRNIVNDDVAFLMQTEAVQDAPGVVNALSVNFRIHTVTSRRELYKLALPTWMRTRQFKIGEDDKTDALVDCTEFKPKGPTILKLPGVVAIFESDAYKIWEIQKAYAAADRELPDIYLLRQPGEQMSPPQGTIEVPGWKHNGRSIERQVLARARDRFDLTESLEHRLAA